ncbi:MAG TPA: Nre family DNA repair protein [archaeon]|nr:Nre family DNA repair protein [archaeon]
MVIPLNAVTPSPEVCVKCKGRLWCGPKCFILERQEKKTKTLQNLMKKEIQSASPPGVFVSWHGYPKVNLSPMAPAIQTTDDSWLLDDTDKWFGLASDKIINFRESLVRGNMSVEIKQASDPSYKLLEIQETLMAKKPVDIEMKFSNAPHARNLSFSDFHAPMGPQADLKDFSMTENPSVNPKIEKFVSDTDAKSLDAMVELYKNSVGVNQLHKILSAGMLGIGKNRKFVPTRWSITAIDSNLSEHFVDEKIKYFPQIGSYKLFHSNYLENYFYILLVPRFWSFELMEAWKPGASWNLMGNEPTFMTDYEFFEGRKGYAENTAGGYYATRIAIAEYLLKTKKQATALVFREIGDAGIPSLGVWKCREIVRDALKQRPIEFSGLDLALQYVNEKLVIPIDYWYKNSVLLKDIKHQKRITDYFVK